MTEKSILKIKDLEVVYKTEAEVVHAVNRINLEVNRGEALGIVGETGAGKTTTALSILSLLPETTARIKGGEIIFKGNNLLELEKSKILDIRGKQIAMIFQDPMTSLNPIMTIGYQIQEAIEFHDTCNLSKEEIDARVCQVLELVGISPVRKNDFPHELSGGMKQRVVIAIALVCEPELLIADEPTTALDVTIQAQVLAMIGDLRNRLGTAMIMISHSLGVIAQICDKVAVMYAGEIVESGTMEEIFSGVDHHPYTLGLFGSIPNLNESRKRLQPIDGLMPDPTNLPVGCSFSPRCPNAFDICYTISPEIYSQNNHHIKCHLFSHFSEDIKKRQQL